MIEATHEITAVYFPKTGDAELTYKDLDSGDSVAFTVKVTPEIGERLSRVVWPCVYTQAIIGKKEAT